MLWRAKIMPKINKTHLFFFTGLRRVWWHLAAQVLVYHPRLPALPSSWPLQSVWVCMSRNEGCLWNLTWCIVERWPDHHWPLALSERLQSRMIFLSLPGVGLSSRGCVPLRDICPQIKHCCCIAFNTSSVHIEMCFWCLIMFWVITLVSKWF